MKHTFHLLMLIIALLLPSCAFDKAEPSPYDLYRVEVDTFLNIRTTPSKKGHVVGTFNNGALIDVIEISDGWAKVSYRGEEIGYVSSEYLVLVRHAQKPLAEASEETEQQDVGKSVQTVGEDTKNIGEDTNQTTTTETDQNVFFIGDSTLLAGYEKEEIMERLHKAPEYTFIINAVQSVPTGEIFDYAPDVLKNVSKELDSSMNWWQRVKSWFGGDSPSSTIVLISWIKNAGLLQAECNGNSLKYLKMSEPEKYFRLQTAVKTGIPRAIGEMGIAIDQAGKEYAKRNWWTRAQINTGNILDNICEDWIVENILPRDSFWHKWVLGWIFALPLKFANWLMTVMHSYLLTLLVLMVVMLILYFFGKASATNVQQHGVDKVGCLVIAVSLLSIIANIFLWLSMISLLVYMMPDMSTIAVMVKSGFSEKVIRTAMYEFYSSPVTKNWLLILLFIIGTAICMGVEKDHIIIAALPSGLQKHFLKENKEDLRKEFEAKDLTFEYESWVKMEYPYRDLAITEFFGNGVKILLTVLPLAFVFNGTLLLYASIFLWTIAFKKFIHIGVGINAFRRAGAYN